MTRALVPPTALLLLCACSGEAPDGADEARRYAEATQRAATDPAAARALCAALQEERVRGECILYTLDQQAQEDPNGALAVCQTLEGWVRGECVFIAADVLLDPHLCVQATPYEAYCYDHVFSGTLKNHLGEAPLPIADVDAVTRQIMAQLGYSTDYVPAWKLSWALAFYPLDPAPDYPCAALPPSPSKQGCRAAFAERWPEAAPAF